MGSRLGQGQLNWRVYVNLLVQLIFKNISVFDKNAEKKQIIYQDTEKLIDKNMMCCMTASVDIPI